MSNCEQQADEIEVLMSIYGNRWSFDKRTDAYSIDISENIKLYVTLNDDYPSHKPPTYDLLAPLLSRSQKEKIAEEFKKIYEESCGGPVLYQWVERLRELAEEESNESDVNENADDVTGNISSETEVIDLVPHNRLTPEIVHGPTIVDRKSVFQGHCARIESQEEVQYVIDLLMQNKKIKQATHNISSYRIQGPNGILNQDCDDDGENHAGGRLLHLLQILDLKNVIVVVSRWYGGIQLGPDRFKHINNAARQALVEASLINQ